MKALRVAAIAIGLLVAALAAYVLANALYPTRPVGFQRIQAADAGHTPLAMGVWYPTGGRPLPTTLLGMNLMSVAGDGPVAGSGLPLVVITHGNGGGPGSHVDLALALAQQGFVVAAPMHTGDNFADQGAVGSARWLVDRTRHIHAAIDHMLTVWPAKGRIDAARIGVFGFSAGGFTALTAIGGVPELQGLAAHCNAKPEFVCRLLADARAPLLNAAEAPLPGAFARDARIKAAAIAAPGLGFTFVPDGLTSVTAPVQLWSGAADQNVPTVSNAGPVAKALAGRVDFREVPGAGHFAFLAPCGLFGPPALCRDADGFDRQAFHQQMNDAVVKFFQAKL